MGRHFTHNPHFCEMRGMGHGGGGRRRGGRLFDYGELRLLVLALIAEQPAHGYELIKTIEERFGGSYTPSPGVIYPTLSWLEDMGYARVEPKEGGRKSYAITDEGQAFLKDNQDAAQALLERAGAEDGRGHRGRHVEVMRAMQNLKTALRLRLREGALDQSAIDEVAAAIDEAASKIGKL
jgi:DNA-binding PadR family transcriptional regulator